MIDFLSFHDLSQERASIYFKYGLFFIIESLFISLFIIEWLFISPPPPLIEEQSGKMEPKYSEGSHCQSVLCPQGVLTSPFLIN